MFLDEFCGLVTCLLRCCVVWCCVCFGLDFGCVFCAFAVIVFLLINVLLDIL